MTSYLCLYVVMTMAFVIDSGKSFIINDSETTRLGAEEDVKKPYGDCETYTIGNETQPKKFADGASVAFYPITDEATTLFLKISIAKNLYKVTIVGTTMTLEKCDYLGESCVVTQEGGVKTIKYIRSQQWNKVSASVTTKKISIMINSRKVMSMEHFEQEDLNEAQWRVASTEKIDPEKGMPPIMYLAQFNCTDAVLTHMPNNSPRSEVDFDDDESSSESTSSGEMTDKNFFSSPAPHSDADNLPDADEDGINYEMMIVGVVIGAILLVTLAVILHQVYKKRQSANLNLGADQQTTQTI